MLTTAHNIEAEPAETRVLSAIQLPTEFGGNAVKVIAIALNGLLADSFALYIKTKNFHWHVSGPHFRDYHLLFEQQAEQIFAATDPIAERVRKIGGTTLRSLDQAVIMTRVPPNEAEHVEPADMLAELFTDNQSYVAQLRAAHVLCAEHGDVATASLIENWINEAEERTWFLYETLRPAQADAR